MLVSNLINDKGNAVANQFVIVRDNGNIDFQSYDSLVCSIASDLMGFDKVVVFGCDWDYSRTTMKHLNKFLDGMGVGFDSSADIRKAIKKGYHPNNEKIKIIYDEDMV